MLADSPAKQESWKVMSFLLDNKQNLGWAKTVGVMPIHNGAEQDEHFKTEQFKGWFEELQQPGQVCVRDAADPSRKPRRVL